MSNQKTETEIGVDGSSVTLQWGNTGEDPETDTEEDDGEGAADNSEEGEEVIVGADVTIDGGIADGDVFIDTLAGRTYDVTALLAEDIVDVHEHSKVCQMLTTTRGAMGTRGHNSTSSSVPDTCLCVPEHTFYRTQRKFIFFAYINVLKCYHNRNVVNWMGGGTVSAIISSRLGFIKMDLII